MLPLCSLSDELSSQAYMMRQAISTLDFEGDADKFIKLPMATVFQPVCQRHCTLRAKGEGPIRTADETQSWSAHLKRENGGETILVAM
ncbi:hypothetical protein BV22DRAFT_1038832 [Leucogyrophana mollusca]|uniref:Uncharacterized protein n=1 Tax=Leucogyrophana mollusca TaxID=85980 RepID=A0ACB8B6C4_9AGAM|nr:hypothetical protein BV22DRAFT_1038832 [Leucogyrophana mollusca]